MFALSDGKLRFLFVFLLLSLVPFASARGLKVDWMGPSTEIEESGPSWTVIEIELSELQLEEFSKGLTSGGAKDMGDVWSVVEFVAIPSDGHVQLTVLDADFISLPDVVLPVDDRDGEDVLPPFTAVEIGSPGVLRDLRVVPVIFHPVHHDRVGGDMKACRRIRARIDHGGPLRSIRRPFSETFRRLYHGMVANFDEQLGEFRHGSYLVIVHDQFVEEIQPLVSWRHRQGWETRVVPLSEIGTDPDEDDIKSYVLQAYQYCEVPPDHLLLVGDTQMQLIGELPGFYIQRPHTSEWDITDHPYSLLEGEDFLPDVMVGRLSVDSEFELRTVVNKILRYERTPYLGQTAWYRRALMVAGNYSETPPTPVTPRLTKLWIRDQLLAHGYAQVDTIFYPGVYPGTNQIASSINGGVSFINYRGWADADGWQYPVFKVSDIQDLNNGRMLPVVTSIVCNTGDFDNSHHDPCFGEAWLRAGNLASSRGGVAFLGPSDLHTETKWNNSLDAGFYWGMLWEGLTGMAQASTRGKLELYRGFPSDVEPGGWVEFYFHVYNVLGDPALEVWTDVPESLLVHHPTTLKAGDNFLEVTVAGLSRGPVEGAWVCLSDDDGVHLSTIVDVGGFAHFVLPHLTLDTLWVTVTAPNCIPYEGHVLVEQSDVRVGYDQHAVDDSEGNGDGQINPGETIHLSVTLRNYGAGSTASGVSAVLRADDDFVLLMDSTGSYGDIAPGGTDTAEYQFTVSPACSNGHLVAFQMAVTASDSQWSSVVQIPVLAPDLAFHEYQVDGGTLDPGETGSLVVTLFNRGSLGSPAVTANLSTRDNSVTIDDPMGNFGPADSGSTVANVAKPFVVTVAPSAAVGRRVLFELHVTSQSYQDVASFHLTIGADTTTAPLGPDSYGYYAYDDTDVRHDEAPAYQWAEIDTAYGGVGTLVALGDDRSTVVSLPFLFRYYGQEFHQATLCSNGWLSLGSTWMTDFRNWNIPAALGPPAMIAPFWDDLDSTRIGAGSEDVVHVYYLDDVDEHRFIVQWSRVLNRYDASLETFQAILLDPAHHPTPTGDGEIVFQYQTVNNTDASGNFATAGIESPAQNDGIEYTFANQYPPTAAPLADGRAIKFTTDPPDTFTSDVSDGEEPSKLPTRFALLQSYPNPFNPATVIPYHLPASSAGGRRQVAVSLKVYNISGQVVRTLVNQMQPPGFYAVEWDGRDDRGLDVSTGVYLYQLRAGEVMATGKAVLLR